jgi:hypothetical protein
VLFLDTQVVSRVQYFDLESRSHFLKNIEVGKVMKITVTFQMNIHDL